MAAFRQPPREFRWVYVYEAHVIGIGTQHLDRGEYQGFWNITVLPDWMSDAFMKRLTVAAIGDSDPIHYVQIVAPEDKLIKGESVQSFELIDDWHPRYSDNPYDRFQHLIPPTPMERAAGIRILLDGVLIWGAEEYPGERKIVVPKVKIPKKLREGDES